MNQRCFASLSDTVVYEWFMFVMKASTKMCQMASEEKVDEGKDVTVLPAWFSFLDFRVSGLKCIWLLEDMAIIATIIISP